MKQPLYDVAIVGYGPTGAVLAALLGQAGFTVYVCDKLPGVYEIPRALAMDHEIMRVFQQLGLSEALAPFCEPFTPSEYYGVDGQLIRRMTMVDPPYPQGHVPSLVFSQPPLEKVLRARVAQCPGVTVTLATECLSMEQSAQQVCLTVKPHGHDPQKVRARWLVACDGGSSAMRTALGARLDDLGFDEPWLVVDVRVNEAGLARLPKVSVQYCEPERPATFVIGPGNHRRWEISLQPGEDPRAMATPEQTWRLLSRWIGPEHGELWRQTSYRFHALVAQSWRRGRVFLAGDAAHMQPPFLGQGMCQGIRDAVNLAWKLSAVIREEVSGVTEQRLLDSYGQERQAHVRELTARIKQVGAVICERDVQRARERDAQILAACGGRVPDTPRQDMMPPLTSGVLMTQTRPGRGELFVQPRLQPDGRLMDDALGLGWRWVTLGDCMPSQLPKAITPCVLQDEHAETQGVVAAWMQRRSCQAALVRPDHVVFGVASTREQADALILDWAQWMAPKEPR
jgi:3-(3-hydroxy-phenyl)propionate hydroxylase